LHHYFKPISKLPDPNGRSSKEIPSVAIREQIKVRRRLPEVTVRSVAEKNMPGLHLHRQLKLQFAMEHGNQAAIRQYSKEFRVEVKDSTFRTWKSKYRDAIKECRESTPIPEKLL